MIHYFDTDIAQEYGIEEAVVIQNFAFWISKNAANGTHFYDGRVWTYNSTEALLELIPEFKTIDKIKRVIKSLIEQDIILKGNYNKTPMDRTCWYAFTDKGLELISRHNISTQCIVQNCTMESAKTHNGKCENAQAIPDIISNNIPDNISDIKSPYIPQGGVRECSTTEVSNEELVFDRFRKAYRGTKRGLATEFTNFKKKHKDWKQVLPNLLVMYERQCSLKDEARQRGCFVAQEKNLQTYINQRCWEEEPQFSEPQQRQQKETVLDKMKFADEMYHQLQNIR